jgi:hypothetical protein
MAAFGDCMGEEGPGALRSSGSDVPFVRSGRIPDIVSWSHKAESMRKRRMREEESKCRDRVAQSLMVVALPNLFISLTSDHLTSRSDPFLYTLAQRCWDPSSPSGGPQNAPAARLLHVGDPLLQAGRAFCRLDHGRCWPMVRWTLLAAHRTQRNRFLYVPKTSPFSSTVLTSNSRHSRPRPLDHQHDPHPTHTHPGSPKPLRAVLPRHPHPTRVPIPSSSSPIPTEAGGQSE